MSVVVSFRIDEWMKRKMDELKHINWSEVVRKTILDVIKREEAKLRSKDFDRLRRALLISEKLYRKIEGWNSVREIKRWRERR